MVERVGSTPIDQTAMLKRCHTTAGISALLVLSLTWKTVESKKCQESSLPMEECMSFNVLFKCKRLYFNINHLFLSAYPANGPIRLCHGEAFVV